MKSLSFLVLCALFAVVASVHSAMYDFGTMQQGSFFKAEPGDTVTLNIFFFMDEEYGDRITHIKVATQSAPDGWEIEFDPPLHDEHYNISGVITLSQENLYVEPKPVLPEIPDPEEEGVYYLLSPSGKGYLQAKKLDIKVTIPESAQLGETYDLKFLAEAFWFEQTGNIALTQSRSFTFQIQLANLEYSEQLIDINSQTNQTDIIEEIVESEDLTSYITGALLVVVVLLIAYIVISKNQNQDRSGYKKQGRKSRR